MKVRVLVLLAGLGVFGIAALTSLDVHAAGDNARVELKADNMGPRPIEDLTRDHIVRDYTKAWETMQHALANRDASLLNAYFTGEAKTGLASTVADEARTGVTVRYLDHGHKLDGIFYSPAGDAMQLQDRAELEMQVLDGDKVIHSENVTMNYMVLMTPGADRWLVRYLQSIPGGQR
jgi:hypothetical protein